MDIWILAAAAGAGYVAQHCKDRMRSRQSSSGSSSETSKFVKPKSSSLIRKHRDKNSPFDRLEHRKNIGKHVSKERDLVSQGASRAEVASTSGFDDEKLVILGNYEDCNVVSTSGLSPGFVCSNNLHVDQEGVSVSGDISETSGDLLLKPFTGEMGSSYGSVRNRIILRSSRANGQFIKPLSSGESCLVTQLYKEHAEMEEYIFRSVPASSTPSVRPFPVTDGSRIISRANGDSFNVQTRTGKNQLHKETNSEENVAVFGIPLLPNIGSMETLRKIKFKTGNGRGRRLRSSGKIVNGKHPHGGSSHGAFLFCLGISMGIISSLLTNKREVDKLNELLKQTENLVQDLQEELEMKDSLTVKELAVEDYESQDTNDYSYNNGVPHEFSPGQDFGEPRKYDHEEFHDQKTEEECLSKIEAELEAELERLELNMNSSSLEGKLSDLVELDPDFVPDIVQGELRTDMFRRQSSDAQPYADRDGSGNSTTHSANYTVSPRELSLRLHEVLQSRLEERVKELETELQNSQRKVWCRESEHTISWREFSNSEAGSSSSIQGSPIAREEQMFTDEPPVVINLSEGAVDVYNEAYDEFTKTNASEEEDSSHDIGTSGDENDNGRDEMEKLLIKQLLEKTRKGSPVVLNAQRALFSVDGNEH